MKLQSRRTLLKQSLAAAGGWCLAGPDSWTVHAANRGSLPVAGVATVYERGTHADVILGKILEGFHQDGGPGTKMELVSLYLDQYPQMDMGRQLAKKHGFLLARTIDEAVNLGGDQVGVAGVLSIGEHGKYPTHPRTNQRMYPRKRFFDEIVAALERGGKVVPVFNDKHLSYRTDEALAMYRTAAERNIPFMAGSSIPVTWRDPALDLPKDCAMEGAMVLGFGGPEVYGFHALEALQCMVERRRGGEVGVKAVRIARGTAALEAERQGYWSRELLAAALRAQDTEVPENWREVVTRGQPFYLVEYRDGFKACVWMLGGIVRNFLFACQLQGQQEPAATRFATQQGAPHLHFMWLVKAIEHMVHTGTPAYPVERTVLTTGIIDAAMRSLADGDERVATPQLDIGYRPSAWSYPPGLPPTP